MASQTSGTILQAQTIADTAGTWSQTLAFGQFDPSLGTLLDINLGLAGNVAGSVSIENLEAAPASFTVSLPSLISVTGPGDTVSVTPDASGSVSLAAFDGTLDYAGTSGTTLGGLSNTQIQAVVLQPGSGGTDPAVGAGTIALPVSASTSLEVTGPANMQILSHASAGAVVTLGYTYSGPESGAEDSYDSSFIMFGGDYNANLDISPVFWSTDLLTTAAQTISVADGTTGWTNLVAAQQFDPALGTLEQVNVTLSSDIQGSIAAENLDPEAASIDTTQTATVTLDLPGASAILSTSASVANDATVAGYDGSTDFAGPSGFTDLGPNLQATSGNETATTSDDLAAFTGPGTIDLPIVSSSTATLDGPGNLLAKLLAQSGATVTVSYTYQPVPVVSDAGDTVSFVPGATAVADPGISLSDAGTSWLTSATVAITGGLLPGDLLTADTTGTGISASYDAADGTLTLSASNSGLLDLAGGAASGVDTVAAFQQALRSVAFSSGAADPSAIGTDTARNLAWTVTDDFGAASAGVTSTIAVPAPPFISAAAQDVTITQAGTYTVDSLQSAHSVLLDAPGATLVLDASLDVAAGFTLEAGTLVFNGGTLSAGSYDQTSGVAVGNTIDIIAASNFAITGGSIVADARSVASLDEDAAVVQPLPPISSGTLAFLAGDDLSDGSGVGAGSFGLQPAQLASVSGASPATADVWQIVTPTDLPAIGGAVDVLLDPVVQASVGSALQQAGAFNAGMAAAGGLFAAHDQF